MILESKLACKFIKNCITSNKKVSLNQKFNLELNCLLLFLYDKEIKKSGTKTGIFCSGYYG